MLILSISLVTSSTCYILNNKEIDLLSCLNEYYRESQPVEDYINHECNYEAEAMPSLEEIVAILNKEEGFHNFVVHPEC